MFGRQATSLRKLQISESRDCAGKARPFITTMSQKTDKINARIAQKCYKHLYCAHNKSQYFDDWDRRTNDPMSVVAIGGDLRGSGFSEGLRYGLTGPDASTSLLGALAGTLLRVDWVCGQRSNCKRKNTATRRFYFVLCSPIGEHNTK